MLPHFTIQQQQGGVKYHHKTRIGNWVEDREMDEIKYRNQQT